MVPIIFWICVTFVICVIIGKFYTDYAVRSAIEKEKERQKYIELEILEDKKHRNYEKIVEDFSDIQESLAFLERASEQRAEALEIEKLAIESKIVRAQDQAQKSRQTGKNITLLLTGKLATAE